MNHLPKIKYIALLGDRDKPISHNIPMESVAQDALHEIGALPQNFEHFIYGCDYYSRILLSREYAGYDVVYVYDDNIDHFIAHSRYDKMNCLVVLLLCDTNAKKAPFYNGKFGTLKWSNVLYYTASSFANLLHLQPVVSCRTEFFDFLYDYALANIAIDWDNAPFSIPNAKDWYDYYYLFKPAHVNRKTLVGILGNWWQTSTQTKQEYLDEVITNSFDAQQKKDTYDRQQMLTNQILKFHCIEQTMAHSIGKLPFFEDQFAPSLIMVLPYTSKDTVEHYKSIDTGMPFMNDLNHALVEVMKAEYTKNYTYDIKPKNPALFTMMIKAYSMPRSNYYDIIGMLYASELFSPYIRLPFVGPSINATLNAVGLEALNKRRPDKVRKKLGKTMIGIGKAISAKVLAPDTIKMIRKRPSQIVAISDLPVEWMDIDGVPLGFSHDVCRIPETPIQSMLSLYMETHHFRYIIPKDLISHTLVIFGCNDDAFVKAQQSVVDLQPIAGFVIERCNSIGDVEAAVKKHKPQLIIFDCHGGVDEALHESYLKIGNERLYSKDVVARQISAPLIILSACVTGVTYNLVESIAHAFFQVGALSVTTSYMPVYVDESTLLYNRILMLLTEACTKPIHRNWLAFMSHVQRTSYLLQPLVEASKKGKTFDAEAMMLQTMTDAKSMMYSKRRSIFKGLSNSTIARKVNVRYEDQIPHYMMYSTLGRADLIQFQSYAEYAHDSFNNDKALTRFATNEG